MKGIEHNLIEMRAEAEQKMHSNYKSVVLQANHYNEHVSAVFVQNRVCQKDQLWIFVWAMCVF